MSGSAPPPKPRKTLKRRTEGEGSSESKKKRNPNWSNDENSALVNAIAEDYDQLVGRFSSSVSQQLKQKLWSHVTDSVS
jgi:Myb/SANT-like DNA-binding protein